MQYPALENFKGSAHLCDKTAVSFDSMNLGSWAGSVECEAFLKPLTDGKSAWTLETGDLAPLATRADEFHAVPLLDTWCSSQLCYNVHAIS